VTHKEAIKKLKTDVDVLTLTATPIPRTLEMSLTGIRDLTLLNTPPAERQPILTYVGAYDERAAAEAIRRELLREGQVFFVHNRVQDIEHVAAGMRAYAYLFYPPEVSLTEEAYERLKTIGETTELGSGFKIAMRDLEIRGAGNLLGTGQSGHIAAVGYDLYCQMVNEAVAELKGEPLREPAEIKLDLPLDANLPKDYVPRE